MVSLTGATERRFSEASKSCVPAEGTTAVIADREVGLARAVGGRTSGADAAELTTIASDEAPVEGLGMATAFPNGGTLGAVRRKVSNRMVMAPTAAIAAVGLFKKASVLFG